MSETGTDDGEGMPIAILYMDATSAEDGDEPDLATGRALPPPAP